MDSQKISVSPVASVKAASRLKWAEIPCRSEPERILMCPPSYFEIKDSKNPHMEGHLHKTDLGVATRQWESLQNTFQGLGYQVEVINPEPDLEDMVFTANQVLPGKDSKGSAYVVLSQMAHASRRREVPYFESWFRRCGYQIMELTPVRGNVPVFEGQGDAIWHPGKQLLWGGWGFRTQELAYDLLANLLKVQIVKLRLINPRFYHLDTAFCTLSPESVMIFAPAFDSEGLGLIKHLFQNVVEVTEAEADNFACNALALGNHVIIQKGSVSACRALDKLGFAPIEVDTSEFMKSGGSVFCLKMLLY